MCSQIPMAEDGCRKPKPCSETASKCTKKTRRHITVAARHRLPQPISTTRKTTASASGSQTRWTGSWECSTTSRHGPRYPSRSYMPPVYNIHVIRACVGFRTHAECPNTLISPTALIRMMKPLRRRKPRAACHHPWVPLVCFNALLTPTALVRLMKQQHRRKPRAACHHPCVPPDALE